MNSPKKQQSRSSGSGSGISSDDDDDVYIENDKKEGDDHDDFCSSGDDADRSSEDLDAMLANMDIEKDFNLWESFRGSMDDIDHKTNTEVILKSNGDTSIHQEEEQPASEQPHRLQHPFEDPDRAKWEQRLQREEIYSKRYRPSAAEEQELQDLERVLGIRQQPSSARRLLSFGRSNSKVVSEEDRARWYAVARPEEQHPSLILKRGPCWLMVQSCDQDDKSNSDEKHDDKPRECEVILLTRGFALALTKLPQQNDDSNNPKKKSSQGMVVPRTFHRAIPWKNVEFVQPSSSRPGGWEVHTRGAAPDDSPQEKTFHLQCSSPQERQAWMDAFQTVLVHHHTHQHHDGPRAGHRLGWQYQFVYQPGFTVAVTNQTDLMNLTKGETTTDSLNTVDEYNGYAPLHYAVKYNHVPAMVALLDAGADVDVQDEEGHTPLYLAVQDELPESTQALLEQYGAAPVDADVSQRGELFGRVAATQEILEERHREQKQQREAAAAQEEIKQNMKLLQRRGEQINELGDKAGDLNQGAADFASMAKQLKEAQKKKRWYQL